MAKDKKMPENENLNPEVNTEENWLDNILGAETPSAELGPDELAVSAAGLTHPDDLELEKILAENWDEEAAPSEPDPDQISFLEETQKFQTVEDTPIQDEPKVQEEVPEEAPTKTPAQNQRPVKKSSYGFFGIPHLLSTVAWLLIILVIGVTLGRGLWLAASDVLAFGKESQAVTITINEEDDIDAIAQKLGDAGLVRYPELFKLFATLTGKEDRISTGTFTLNTMLDYNALVRNMGTFAPAREEITVTIPEGYTCAQIFALLESKGVCTVEKLEEHAANGELREYWFLEGVERGDKYCLEGYLFPDTYFFYTNSSPKQALEKMLNGFNSRFSATMREKLDTIKERTGLSLTVHQVVTIASMVEKETANRTESYTISSVIHNRLRNSASYPFLNIDATLIYALGGNIDPETGKTKPLTYADLEMDNPYNTYKYRGLPPGPISNPGKNSLDAALSPDSTGYYYYVYDPGLSAHRFSSSLSEHEYWVNRIG